MGVKFVGKLHLFLIFIHRGQFFFLQATTEEVDQMKNILKAYEETSGQAINFDKSGVFFSKNIPHNLQTDLSNILGIHDP